MTGMDMLINTLLKMLNISEKDVAAKFQQAEKFMTDTKATVETNVANVNARLDAVEASNQEILTLLKEKNHVQ